MAIAKQVSLQYSGFPAEVEAAEAEVGAVVAARADLAGSAEAVLVAAVQAVAGNKQVLLHKNCLYVVRQKNTPWMNEQSVSDEPSLQKFVSLTANVF